MKRMPMTLILLGALSNAPLLFAQTKPLTNKPNADPDLAMTTIGNGTIFGHRAGFRTYETQDHTKAVVWYSTLQTEQEAKNAIKQSLKEHKITRQEPIKDLNGRIIGDRITATPKEQKNAFEVIQTQGLSIWIIQSSSLGIAMQVAELIEPTQY